MGLGRNLLFLAHILLNIVGLAISQNYYLTHFCYDGYGNYAANSKYQTNLNTLLSSLSSKTDSYGFNSSSLGNNPDRVNANVLCRGDADLGTCRECINISTSQLTQYCPNSKQAIVWYNLCMLRYSNESINGIVSTDPNVTWSNPLNASSVDLFNQALRTLLDKLTSQAASGGILRKYATGSEIGPNFQYIYGLTQCMPDLSERDCTDCLRWIMTNIPICCSGSRGMRLITPSCYLEFENFSFFNSIPANAPPGSTPADAPPGKGDNTTQMIVIVVLTVGSVIVVIVVCICVYLRKRRQRKPKHILLMKRKQRKRRKSKYSVKMFEGGDGISTVESLEYDFDTIKAATDNFSDANKLGQGGFGAVYKGKLENGQEIAVKRLSKGSRQGELEFKNEATLMARLQHRNLVKLLGFCLEGTERLLIYEFMTNSSLDHSIFDPGFLDWERRYQIIRGIARGLLYLHEDSRLRIIHRDLKASNVLLDADMNPKISDFGMARLSVLDETQGNTSRIVGTYGYMSPEYAMHGQFSVKSDVFSFGVLVLEIISGQKNKCFRIGENTEHLLSYAWKCWREGSASNLIDPTLQSNHGSMREMMRCIHLGLLCVQENVANRPTIASVVLMLNSFSLTLSMPAEPAFFQHSSIDPELPLLQEYYSGVSESSHSKTKSHGMSINEDSITELYPR